MWKLYDLFIFLKYCFSNSARFISWLSVLDIIIFTTLLCQLFQCYKNIRWLHSGENRSHYEVTITFHNTKSPNAYRAISQTDAVPVAGRISAALLVSNLKRNANCKLFCKDLLSEWRAMFMLVTYSYLLNSPLTVLVTYVLHEIIFYRTAGLVSFNQRIKHLNLQSKIFWLIYFWIVSSRLN